jgi:hypothetical protein
MRDVRKRQQAQSTPSLLQREGGQGGGGATGGGGWGCIPNLKARHNTCMWH